MTLQFSSLGLALILCFCIPRLKVTMLHSLSITAAFLSIGTALMINQPATLQILQNASSSSVNSTSLNPSLTGRWDAECYYLSRDVPDFNATTCPDIIVSLCDRLTPEKVKRNKWVWEGRGRCGGAYYIGDDAYVTGKSYCTLIMETIYQECVVRSQERYNYKAGSHNVEVLPGPSQDGKAKDPKQAMFVLTSQKF